MLCDSRRILKIGKVVRKKENGDEREQKKFLHCERRNAYYILRIEGRIVEENDADDVSVRFTVYKSAPVRRLEGCRLNYRNSCVKRQKRV